jgi:hypothetical protein
LHDFAQAITTDAEVEDAQLLASRIELLLEKRGKRVFLRMCAAKGDRIAEYRELARDIRNGVLVVADAVLIDLQPRPSTVLS